MSDKNLTLPIKSWRILKNCLLHNGWAKTHKEIYVSGKMDDDNVIDIPEPPDQSKGEEATNAWANEVKTIQLTENQIEVCLIAADFALEKQLLFANKYTAKVFTSLKEAPKVEE